jgi:hypothetical protein
MSTLNTEEVQVVRLKQALLFQLKEALRHARAADPDCTSPDRPPQLSHTILRYAAAYRLIELGARAGLVCQLTSLPRATIKTWYQQIRGQRSPPGLMPFSDTWYARTEQHILHTNIVWRLGCEAERLMQDPAWHLIAVYEAYLAVTPTPLLNITRAHFVSGLLRVKLWRTAQCEECATTFVGPVADIERLCPACRLQRAHRCVHCGSILLRKKTGRRLGKCPACGGSQARSAHRLSTRSPVPA